MSVPGKRIKKLPPADSFESLYPHIAFWVAYAGWIEIGNDERSPSFVRALDGGGMVWEGKRKYKSVGEAFRALEIGLRAFMLEQGIGPYSRKMGKRQ
jgi:hypothetical protein